MLHTMTLINSLIHHIENIPTDDISTLDAFTLVKDVTQGDIFDVLKAISIIFPLEANDQKIKLVLRCEGVDSEGEPVKSILDTHQFVVRVVLRSWDKNSTSERAEVVLYEVHTEHASLSVTRNYVNRALGFFSTAEVDIGLVARRV